MTDLPTGARLDRLVLWAVGVLDKEDDIWSGAVTDQVFDKVGIPVEMNNDRRLNGHVQRAITRLEDEGLIYLDTGLGYKLVRR